MADIQNKKEKIDDKVLALIRRYRFDPVSFAKDMFGITLDVWQEIAALEFAVNQRLAARAGHGIGKTTFETIIIYWFLFTRPNCRVVATAPTQNHLFGVLWAECKKWLDKSLILQEYFEWQKTKIVSKSNGNSWFAVAKTASKPEGMAGTHQDEKFSGVLILIDEASGVEDEVIEALEGSITNEDCKMLLCGNPVKNSGYFNSCFNEDDRFIKMTISCLDTKLVKRDIEAKKNYAKGLEKKYGKESNVYRVRVSGLPPKNNDDSFIYIELYQQCLYKEREGDKPLEIKGKIQIGVDVARHGNDASVIYPKVGNVILPKWKRLMLGKDGIMVVANKAYEMALNLMARYNEDTATIVVDDNGVGAGVADRLIELSKECSKNIIIAPRNFWSSVDKNLENIEKSRDGNVYIPYDKWGVQMWAYAKHLMENKEIIFYEYDEDLEAQLSIRKYSVPMGKIKLESKDEMKARKVHSPDDADAFVLACCPIDIEEYNAFIDKKLLDDPEYIKFVEELKKDGLY